MPNFLSRQIAEGLLNKFWGEGREQGTVSTYLRSQTQLNTGDMLPKVKGRKVEENDNC